MASIRKAKKLGIYKKVDYDKQLYARVKIEVDKANARLRSLEKTGNYNSYASKKLFDRLDTQTLKVLSKYRKGGKISGINLTRQLTNTQLVAIEKAVRQFLVSSTSTPKGIRNVKQATIKAIKTTLSEEDSAKVTEEDAEFYYKMLGENDFDYFADKIGASTLWTLIDSAKEENSTQSSWINTLSSYVDFSQDADVREKAINLYNKYIA